MTENQLIPLEQVSASDLFSEKSQALDGLLVSIKKEARKLADGIGVEKDSERKELASIAYKIARSKTTIDNAGKDFAANLKQQVKVIDQNRKVARDALDELRDEIRAPLNRWEENEKARVQAHTDAIEAIREQGIVALDNCLDIPADALRNIRTDVEAVDAGQFEEFAEACAEAKVSALSKIVSAITRRARHDQEQAELEQFRKEKAERDEQERIKEMERQAKEKAEREAQEKIAAEREAREKAERERDEAEQKAEFARIQAEKEAQDKRDAEAEEKRRREANTRHKGKCNNEAVSALMTHAKLDAEQARLVVTAIAKGQVPRVTINY